MEEAFADPGTADILQRLHDKRVKQDTAIAVAEGRAPAPQARPEVHRTAQQQQTFQEPAAEGQQPASEQPAEAETQTTETTTEGEQPDVEQPQTLRVKVQDDQGATVEQDITLEEAASGYMRHADYTRKTQKLAKDLAVIPQKMQEADNTIMAARSELQQNLQYLQAVVQSVAMAELQSVDWNRLQQENPNEYIRLINRKQQFSNTLGELQNYQNQVKQKATEHAQQRFHQARADMLQTLNREIPGGYNEDLAAKLTKGLVNEYGFLPEEISNNADARIIKMAKDALELRELKRGKPIAQQKVDKAPLAVRPNAPATPAEKANSQVDRQKAALQKSGSVEDAMKLMQLRRQNTRR